MDSTPLPGTWSLFTLFFKGTLFSVILCVHFFIPVFSSGSSVHDVHSTDVLLNSPVHINPVPCHVHFNSIESIQGKRKILFWNPRHCWYAGSFDIESEKPDWKVVIWITHRGCRGYLVCLCQNPPSPYLALLIFCLRRQEVLMSYFIARFEGSIPLLAISPLIFQIGLAQKEYSAGVSHVSGILSLL